MTTSIEEALEREFLEQCQIVADMTIAIHDEAPMAEPHRSAVIARSAYSIGLEIGLAIAITDIAAARRLQEWYDRTIQENDPDARAGREHQVENYLRVLDSAR